MWFFSSVERIVLFMARDELSRPPAQQLRKMVISTGRRRYYRGALLHGDAGSVVGGMKQQRSRSVFGKPTPANAYENVAW